MKIIDIHTHVYPEIRGISEGMYFASKGYGICKHGNEDVQFLPPSFVKSNSPVEVHRAYMKWLGIDQALLMANTLYGYYNDYISESVKKYPDVYRGVAFVEPFRGEASVQELAKVYEEGVLFGMKLEVNSCFACHMEEHMTGTLMAPFWDYLNSVGQPVFIHPFRPFDVADILQLAQQYKNINFIICHMGAEGNFGPHAQENNFDLMINTVAHLDNVFLDTSTVPYYVSKADEEYPYPTTIAFLEKAYHKVGAEKMMWSSDYPGMLVMATYRQLIDLIVKNCKAIPAGDKEKIMGLNAYNMFFK